MLSFVFVLRTIRYRIGKHHQEILIGFEFGKDLGCYSTEIELKMGQDAQGIVRRCCSYSGKKQLPVGM